MKRTLLILTLLSAVTLASAQTMKQYTVGWPLTISLPDYMSRTTGLNQNAIIEYKSEVKDVYGFVIIDDKETLKMAELNYTSTLEFYEDFIKGFIEGEQKVTQSKPISKTVGNVKFIEADVSYYDKNAQTQIYYLIGIVETPKSYYKVLSYCADEQKAKFKEDFRKILYSLKD